MSEIGFASAGLQSDPVADGAGGDECRYPSPKFELQAYRAVVERMAHSPTARVFRAARRSPVSVDRWHSR